MMKQEKKKIWISKSIAEDIGTEEVLRSTLIDFFIYIVFLTLSTIYIIGMHSSSVYYLTKALKQQFLEQEFETINNVGIQFEDIKSAADVWSYIENHAVRSFFWESSYHYGPDVDQNAMNILYENKVLGVPRLRQVKVRNDSCTIHNYFRRIFVDCFGAFSSKSEDVAHFGVKNDTAWNYNYPKDTKNLPYSGEISFYTGGGFYIDFPADKNKTVETIQELKHDLWITRGTRAVFIDFSVYNANLNIFGICKIIFEFPTTGGVIPSAKFYSVRLLRFHTFFDFVVLFCEGICYFFIIYYLLEEIREMIYFRTKYIWRFWNYIDLTIIGLFIAALVLSVLVYLEMPAAINEIKANLDKYGNLEYATKLYNVHKDVAAIALFLIYLKAFKFLNFNKTMSQLNDTLSNCAMDVLGFSLMFFIVFFAYAELGYLLFGNQVEDFSSFSIAMFTLLRTILGDFDYKLIEEANKILAPIYFLSYIFLVFFVLLNMFLAIISDSYGDVKTAIAIGTDEMKMMGYLKKKLGALFGKLGFRNFVSEEPEGKVDIRGTVSEIRDVLKKCGYSDLEIEMFFARYNVSPLAEMHIEDSDKLLEELQKVLNPTMTDPEANFVKLEDFYRQQEKLNTIESNIGSLVKLLKEILNKLEKMDAVKKERKENV